LGEADRDVVVVGAGPAGLQAAIHAARRKVSVCVLGRTEASAIRGHALGNLCGLEGSDGAAFLETGRRQAAAFGAELVGEDAVKLKRADEDFSVLLESGRELRARALVLATGAARARLGVPGEKELAGRGVSYCVDCDAGFFRGKAVAVVGDGSAAVEGALALLGYAEKVHLVTAGPTVSAEMRRRLDASAVVRVEPDRVARIEGDEKVRAVTLESGGRIGVSGVFVELGSKGVLELTIDLGVALDPESFRYVVVDRRQGTNVPGVFAAGDVTGPPLQIAKALGEGCVAGLRAAEHARKTGGGQG
jgi:thioredoxin reductase (NADPH)